MSAGELFADILHGNLSHAWDRLMDWYSGWPDELKELIHKLTDDEGAILWNAAKEALADAAAGQSITEIADELWDTLKEQVPGKAKEDLLDALGIQARAK